MKLLSKITGILMATAMVTLSGIPAFAAGDTYRETTMPLVQNKRTDSSIINLYVHSDGSIDYFTEQTSQARTAAKKTIYRQFHSKDNGKTWNEISLAWISEAIKKYKINVERPISSFFMTDTGIIYCIFPVCTSDAQNKSDVYSYFHYKILEVSKGVVREIPNVTLSGKTISQYTIGGMLPNGILAVCGKGITNNYLKTESSFMLVDPLTGKTSNEFTLPSRTIPTRYANGKVYGIRVANESVGKADLHFVEYDLSGKLLTDIFLKMSPIESMMQQKMEVDKDGIAYVIAEAGLFRRVPGESKFTKVLDGTKCKLGNHAFSEAMFVCDRNVYSVMCHLNITRNDDPMNFTQYQIYCYIPN